MTHEVRDQLVKCIKLGLDNRHSEVERVMNLLAAAVITPAQQAVLDAADAWYNNRSELENFFTLVFDAIPAMIAEKNNPKP